MQIEAVALLLTHSNLCTSNWQRHVTKWQRKLKYFRSSQAQDKIRKNSIVYVFFVDAQAHISRYRTSCSMARSERILSCLSSFAECSYERTNTNNIWRDLCTFFSEHFFLMHICTLSCHWTRSDDFFFRHCSTTRNWIIGVNVCLLALSGETQ